MNIFYLDSSPRTCARYHCDKHVVKMIVETAQLLCGAHWATGGKAQYLAMGLNHPCGIWTRKSLSNYKWLCELGVNLCLEYTRRSVSAVSHHIFVTQDDSTISLSGDRLKLRIFTI